MLGSKLLPESTATVGVSPPVLASWIPQPKIHKQKPPAPSAPPYSASPYEAGLGLRLSSHQWVTASLLLPTGFDLPTSWLSHLCPSPRASILPAPEPGPCLELIPSHPGTKVTEDNPILPASCASIPSLSVCPDCLLSRPCEPTLLVPEHASTILCPVPVPRNHHLAYLGSFKVPPLPCRLPRLLPFSRPDLKQRNKQKHHQSGYGNLAPHLCRCSPVNSSPDAGSPKVMLW